MNWGRWAVVLLCADAAFNALALAIAYAGGLRGPESTAAEEAAALAAGIVFLVGLFVVLRWLYLASLNARRIGATDMMVTPVMAIIWWFVPLANLFMPYLTVRELWQASARPKDLLSVPTPALLPVWWALWISGNVAAAAAVLYGPKAPVAVQDAGHVLLLASALAFAWIVSRIETMQRSADHLGAQFA